MFTRPPLGVCAAWLPGLAQWQAGAPELGPSQLPLGRASLFALAVERVQWS